MAMSDQIRKRRIEQGLNLTELAHRSRVSKSYLSQLENNRVGLRPSVDILYRIAFALGTSLGELLEKQIDQAGDEMTDIPEALREFALSKQLNEQDIKMLARITYRGRQPRRVEDWRFLYEAIRRSICFEEELEDVEEHV